MLAANGDIDNLVGAFLVRTALVALVDGDIGSIATLVRHVPVVSDRLGAIEVVEQLRQSPLNLVLVVDEHGSIEGMVTEGDILKTIVADIEEDVGPRIVERDDGSLLIDGAYQMDELSERLGIPLPPNHAYHTVGGFVLNRLRRLPKAGESFRCGLWRTEVVDVYGRRIDKVLAIPQPTLHRGV
jgi:putative hemolysin